MPAPSEPDANDCVAQSNFRPAWWLPSGHLQTLWPSLFRLLPWPRMSRERLELPDGDFIDLDWMPGAADRTAIILHGLEGNSRSHYARGMMATLHARGWRVGVMHFRGCSGCLNRLPRNYHSGDTRDLDFMVERLLSRWPGVPLVLIGFSLGGNVLLKWLAERGAAAPVAAAVAVSVPFQLASVAQRLTIGGSRIYQWRLLSALRRKMYRKLRSRPLPVSVDDVARGTNFYSFDDRITAPLHGFADAADYYRESSCGAYLKAIRRPTLIIHALDDPFMSPDVVPAANVLPKQVRIEVCRHGGHVGFVSGASPFRPRYWLDQRIPRFLEEVTCDT